MEYNNTNHCVDKVFKDFCCGWNFLVNELFSEQKNALQIQLMLDEVQTCSALKTRSRKVLLIYFIIRNIPRKYLCRLSNIHLVAVCESSVLQKHGYNAVLRPIIKDLQKLEDEGILIDDTFRLRGTLINTAGDNLVSHS